MFPHIKPLAGTQINPLHPLSRGLVGCWLFNEGAGSLANGISGHKNHGRLTNMVPNVQGSGWGSDGLDFDGVNDYVITSGIEDIFGTQPVTIVSYVKTATKPSSGKRIGVMCFVESVDTAETDKNFRIHDDGKMHFSLYDGAVKSGISNNDITDNLRHQYVGIYDGTNVLLYVDGVQQTTTDTATGSYNFDSPQIQFSWKGTDDEYFNGSIHYGIIYNRALSAGEIAWLYREPYAMFEPAFNPALLYSAAPPVGAIMNQFQGVNVGADLYNGAIIA